MTELARWLTQEAYVLQRVPLDRPAPIAILYTDAFSTGWFAYFSGQTLPGESSVDLLLTQKNVLDMRAPFLVTEGFRASLQGRVICVVMVVYFQRLCECLWMPGRSSSSPRLALRTIGCLMIDEIWLEIHTSTPLLRGPEWGGLSIVPLFCEEWPC